MRRIHWLSKTSKEKMSENSLPQDRDEVEEGMDHPVPGSGSFTQRSRYARWVLVILAVAALLLLGRRASGLLPPLAAWLEQLGVWGPIVFIAGYALATVAFVPGSILTLAAGAIFGLAK